MNDESNTPTLSKMDRARQIVRERIAHGKPVQARKLQAEYGISHVTFEAASAVETAIAAAESHTRKWNEELRNEVAMLRSIRDDKAVFTKAEFRQLQMLCHPDNPASAETRNRLSQLLSENERRLVK